MGDVDIDYDPLGGPAPAKKMRVRGAKGQLSCNICHFPFTLIGDLKLHKYTDHENQPKPNYLDLAEAALTRLSNKNGGVSSQKLLKVWYGLVINKMQNVYRRVHISESDKTYY